MSFYLKNQCEVMDYKDWFVFFTLGTRNKDILFFLKALIKMLKLLQIKAIKKKEFAIKSFLKFLLYILYNKYLEIVNRSMVYHMF